MVIRESGGGDMRVDVYTKLQTDRDAASEALDIATAATESEALRASHPNATIVAYVWPEDGKAYMTRATAELTDGKLERPVDTYLDSALQ